MLVNSIDMLRNAQKHRRAVPAFNFYNLETAQSIVNAAHETDTSVIMAVSESALKYMGANTCVAMVKPLISDSKVPISLHLDHGRSFDTCKTAIDAGFTSIMIDASDKPFDENIQITRTVADYAHKYNISVEGELGALTGFEDGAPTFNNHLFTDPAQSSLFISLTGVDSLAISIGTSHGAYKIPADCSGCELRFDILRDIARINPNTPLVLHGASTIPQDIVRIINENGGNIEHASGIPVEQLRRAIGLGICKINIDSDARLAFTAAVRKSLNDNPENFDPRKYLTAARDLITQTYIDEIINIFNTTKIL